MNEAELRVTEATTGSPLADDEELYRCIIPEWWNTEESRVSSAAFSFPFFSVDVASLAGSPQATLARFRPDAGIAAFMCKSAREQGCEVRLELDEQYPGNKAHAHVYMPQANKKRKVAARKLVDACRVLITPKSSG
jgi:hypothetical protein